MTEFKTLQAIISDIIQKIKRAGFCEDDEDIEIKDKTLSLFLEVEFKKEAIKQGKYIEKHNKIIGGNAFLNGQQHFIRAFFEITEEDLKLD